MEPIQMQGISADVLSHKLVLREQRVQDHLESPEAVEDFPNAKAFQEVLHTPGAKLLKILSWKLGNQMRSLALAPVLNTIQAGCCKQIEKHLVTIGGSDGLNAVGKKGVLGSHLPGEVGILHLDKTLSQELSKLMLGPSHNGLTNSSTIKRAAGSNKTKPVQQSILSIEASDLPGIGSHKPMPPEVVQDLTQSDKKRNTSISPGESFGKAIKRLAFLLLEDALIPLDDGQSLLRRIQFNIGQHDGDAALGLNTIGGWILSKPEGTRPSTSGIEE
jgi:hypothetical protein